MLGKHPYLLPPRYHLQGVESLAMILKGDLSDKPEVEVGRSWLALSIRLHS